MKVDGPRDSLPKDWSWLRNKEKIKKIYIHMYKYSAGHVMPGSERAERERGVFARARVI